MLNSEGIFWNEDSLVHEAKVTFHEGNLFFWWNVWLRLQIFLLHFDQQLEQPSRVAIVRLLYMKSELHEYFQRNFSN